MKKCPKTLLAAGLAVAMVAPMVSTSALAADIDYKTTVNYSVTESYEWSVPTEITFTADKDTVTADADTGKTQKVKVTKNVIAESKKLQITAKGSGASDAFTITNDAGTILEYSIKVGNGSSAINVGDAILAVNSGTKEGNTALTFTLNKLASGNTAEVPGTYSGSVTYTAEVVNQ